MNQTIGGLVLTTLIATSLFAAEPPSGAEALAVAIKHHDDRITFLRKIWSEEVAEAREELVRKVQALIKLETDQGHLEGVLAARAERDRLDKNLPPEPTQHKVIGILRKAYDAKLATARYRFDKNAASAKNELLARLELLVREETRAGHIDFASTVRKTRTELAAASPVSPIAAEPTETPKSTETVLIPGSPPRPTDPPPSPSERPEPSPSDVVDLKQVIAASAKIRVRGATAIPLDPEAEAQVFSQIPKLLSENNGYIYGLIKNKFAGTAEITVVEPGYLLIACHFGNQGGGGSWEKSRWMPDDFVKNGWTQIPDKELGGTLVRENGANDREQILFAKFVRKGETMVLRCNKYDPPYSIVFGEPDE